MTLEQQDWLDDQRAGRNKDTGLVELIRKTSDGYDPRDQVTFYKTERLGVYSSREAALEAVLAKYAPGLYIQPLEVDG
jgi:hypothetical protein